MSVSVVASPRHHRHQQTGRKRLGGSHHTSVAVSGCLEVRSFGDPAGRVWRGCSLRAGGREFFSTELPSGSSSQRAARCRRDRSTPRKPRGDAPRQPQTMQSPTRHRKPQIPAPHRHRTGIPARSQLDDSRALQKKSGWSGTIPNVGVSLRRGPHSRIAVMLRSSAIGSGHL